MTAQEVLEKFGWVPFTSISKRQIGDIVRVKNGHGFIEEGIPLRIVGLAMNAEVKEVNRFANRSAHPRANYVYKAIAE